MSRRVQVDFSRVSTQTAQHRAAINQAMSNLDREYTQLLSGLRNMDGATNAAFITSTQRNREKAIATAQILERTLTFINNSSMQIQAQDQSGCNLETSQSQKALAQHSRMEHVKNGVHVFCEIRM